VQARRGAAPAGSDAARSSSAAASASSPARRLSSPASCETWRLWTAARFAANADRRDQGTRTVSRYGTRLWCCENHSLRTRSGIEILDRVAVLSPALQFVS
jgi:hypothetical protein